MFSVFHTFVMICEIEGKHNVMFIQIFGLTVLTRCYVHYMCVQTLINISIAICSRVYKISWFPKLRNDKIYNLSVCFRVLGLCRLN